MCKGLALVTLLISWMLWKQRNECTFDNALPSCSVTLSRIKAEATLWGRSGALGLHVFLPKTPGMHTDSLFECVISRHSKLVNTHPLFNETGRNPFAFSRRRKKSTNCSNDLELRILPIMTAMTTFPLNSQYTIGQTRLIINLQKNITRSFQSQAHDTECLKRTMI
jgi:hypothetical protein